MHKLIVSTISLAVICGDLQADDKLYGVNFSKVNWESLCPNVKPLKVRGCNIVHPTSLLFNDDPQTRVKEKYLNCKSEKRKYTKKITPKNFEKVEHKWGGCYSNFKLAYKSRVAKPKYFSENIEEWRNKYLESGVFNENGHVNKELN
jgi:hypothetical protein